MDEYLNRRMHRLFSLFNDDASTPWVIKRLEIT
jgi:hypothetical protein